jgi:ribosomal protein L19
MENNSWNRNYFTNIYSRTYVARKLREIARRNKRLALPGFSKKNASMHKPYVAHRFETGDILNVSFSYEDDDYFFTGICLGIKKTSFNNMRSTVTIRNVIMGVGIELIFALYYSLAYRIRFSDYQRKQFFYYKSKQWHLAKGVNRKTQTRE